MIRKNDEMEKAKFPKRTSAKDTESTDYKIGDVTYHVKSVFQGERDLGSSLANLMLRELESEETANAEETSHELTMTESTDEGASMGIA